MSSSFMRSILEIDESTEPFQTQIIDICSILKITLISPSWSSHFIQETSVEQFPRYRGPREEWALRWLLKRLQVASLEFGSPCLEYRSWLLLRELVLLNTVKNTARLLHAHDFIGLLQKTLEWLHEHSDDAAECLDFSSQNSVAVVDSSSTIEAPTIKQTVKSRKRKRDGYLNMLDNKERKLISDFEILAQQGFFVEHLKSAFRGTSEQAAEVLKSTVSIADSILRKETKNSTESKVRMLQKCGDSAAEIWNLRSIAEQDFLDDQSNRLVSDRCLVPILCLLTTCRRLTDSYSSSFLEDILVKNILLPVRSYFLSTKGTSKPHRNELSSSPTQDLLAPLAKTYSNEADHMKGTSLTLLPISLLFRISIQCSPRKTPKQRSLEDSWLQELFGQLAHYASLSSNVSEFASHSEKYVTTLNQMLRDVISHNISIAAFNVEILLGEVSDVLDRRIDTPMYWDLVGLCIEINPNAFIGYPLGSDSSQENRRKVLKKQMELHLSLVTSSSWKTSAEPGVNYKTKLSQFVLPLAKAFSKTRNLVGFILVWQEQIAISQNSRPDVNTNIPVSDYTTNIWEDEELLQIIAQLVETSLIVGQIDALFKKMIANVPRSGATFLPDDFEADLVVLDCIVNANLNESYVDQLTKSAQSIYILTTGLASSEADLSFKQRWRLWRVLNTLKQRWPMPQDSSGFQLAEQQAIDKALSQIVRLFSEHKLLKHDLVESVHAFRFILTVANSLGENEMSSRLFLAVEAILDHLNVIRESSVQWNGQCLSIDSLDAALLGCVSQLVSNLDVLSNIKLERKCAFFQNLYLAAVTLKKSQQPLNENYVHHLSLWHSFLTSINTQWNRHLTSSFQDFQISIFEDAIHQENTTYWINEFAKYEVAFQALQLTPIYAFKRNRRRQIFVLVFNVLMKGGLPNSALLVDHLNLLTKYIESAHQSQILMRSWQENTDNRQFKGLLKNEVPLVGLFRRIKEHRDLTVDYQVLVALRQLGGKSLMFCTTLLEQEESIEHLVVFFQQLTQIFDDDQTASKNIIASNLLMASLQFYINHIASLQETSLIKFSSFASFRFRHFDNLCELSHLIFERQDDIQEEELNEIGIVFEYLALYADFLGDRSNASEVLSQLSAIVGAIQTKSLGLSGHPERRFFSYDHWHVTFLGLETAVGIRRGDVQFLLQAIGNRKKIQSQDGRNSFLRYIQNVIEHLNPTQKLSLLQMCSKIDYTTNLDPDQLLLQQKVLIIQDLNVDKKEEVAVFSRIYSRLCHILCQPTEYRISMLIMPSMNILLQRQPRIISQWHIDNTIAAIAIMSSHLKLHSQDKGTGIVFIGLCRLFSSILVMHRTKLGGRYHLILPALQGLLRCLFIPYNKPETASSISAPEPTLGISHVTAYSRILTALCDPTVSAVTRSRRRPRRELTDETKKARAIAGQHLHYLIMEYCHLQLHERLPPESKQRLMPGIYAVFNLLSQDVMRAANAAMDSSSREVFKALYEDYQRFGKWNRS